MPRNKTSHVTRFAALGVATVILLAPLSTVSAADLTAQPPIVQSSQVAHNIAQQYGGNPTVAKAVQQYQNTHKTDATTQTRVVVMLKKQPNQSSEAEEQSNKALQNNLIASLKTKYQLTVHRQLGYLVNAFEATVPAHQIAKLSQEPQIASVKKERLYYPTENTARDLQGVKQAFEKHKLDGTGMLISIIDTGIDPTHQDMKLDESAKAHLKLQPSQASNVTQKVPNGWNYADENGDFTDRGPQQHGMHVAGIVAANGDMPNAPAAANNRVNGVAPNAQLLAMKVFSNNPDTQGARDVDIVAAIEDSVKLGADVINMSLGSDNGLADTSSASSIALRKARAAGVLPVVSAGNSGLNFSPSAQEDDAFGKWDDATVGSPSTYADAFGVASVENSHIMQPSGSWTDQAGAQHTIAYAPASGKANNTTYEVVDVKRAKKDEVKNLNLQGKYALAERGDITFAEKFKNVKDQGAAGIVVYNHDKDDAQFIGIGGVDAFKDFFGASITRADALQILAKLKKQEKITISFSEKFTTLNNPDNLKPSAFTSWGPTPELDFKPQIAGIGGNVWSTQNSNRYTTMSGTSMAAPNVAGLSALVLQHYKQQFPQLSLRERIVLAEQALMNTAKIIGRNNDQGGLQSTIPYAPRQIGAGLAQVDQAIATRIIATVNGKSYVPLRQVHGERTISVTLRNIGDKDATFDVPEQVVINESNTPGAPTVTSLSSETLTTLTRQVFVKRGSSTTVNFTLQPNIAAGNHYIEGWVRFTSKTEGQPNIALPYLGFVGDWNAEPMLVTPGQQYAQDINVTTSLLSNTPVFGKLPVNNEVTPIKLGEFSPNRDGWFDAITPSLGILRNFNDAVYSILNESGTKELRQLGEEHGLTRSIVRNIASDPQGYEAAAGQFDGQVWNAQTRRFENLPDGWYTYRIKARLGKNFPWQTYDMKIALDTKGPEVTISDRDSQGNVTITLNDALSEDPGVPAITLPDDDKPINYGDEEKACPMKSKNTRVCTINVGTKAPYIYVTARDNAMNATNVVKVFEPTQAADSTANGNAEKVKKIFILNEKKMTHTTIKASDLRAGKDGEKDRDTFYVEGYATKDVAKITAKIQVGDSKDRKDVPVAYDAATSHFEAYLPVVNGKNTVYFKGFNSKGNKITNKKLALKVNAKAPEIQVKGLDKQGNLPVAADGSIKLAGKLVDSSDDTLHLNVQYQKNDETNAHTDIAVQADGSFATTITPAASAVTVTLVASDGVNTTTQALPLAGRGDVNKNEQHTNDTRSFALTNAGSMGKFSWLIRKIANKPEAVGEDYFVAEGEVGSAVTSVLFTPANRVDAATHAYANPKPIKATIAKGKFSVKLPMRPGLNDFRLQVNVSDDDEDADEGAEITVIDTPASFYFDIHPPVATFEKPTLYGHTLFTNKDTVTFAGSVSDDAFGQSMTINNKTFADFFTKDGDGHEVTRRAFSQEIPVNNKDTVLIRLNDQVNSQLFSLIPVVLDQQEPTAEISVLEGEEVDEHREILVRAKDDYLKSLRVLIDGKPVSSIENKLVERSVESTLIDIKHIDDKIQEDKPSSTELSLKIPTYDLAEGSHTITVEAIDYAGNVASDTSGVNNIARTFIVKQAQQAQKETLEKKREEEAIKKKVGVGNKPADEARKDSEGSETKSEGKASDKPQSPDSATPVVSPTPASSASQLDSQHKGKLTANVNNIVRAGKIASVTLRNVDSEFLSQVCEKGSAKAYAFIYSTPVQLFAPNGSNMLTVQKDESTNGYTFKVVIPSGYSGEHTLAVYDGKGKLLAFNTVKVVSQSDPVENGSRTDSSQSVQPQASGVSAVESAGSESESSDESTSGSIATSTNVTSVNGAPTYTTYDRSHVPQISAPENLDPHGEQGKEHDAVTTASSRRSPLKLEKTGGNIIAFVAISLTLFLLACVATLRRLALRQ